MRETRCCAFPRCRAFFSGPYRPARSHLAQETWMKSRGHVRTVDAPLPIALFRGQPSANGSPGSAGATHDGVGPLHRDPRSKLTPLARRDDRDDGLVDRGRDAVPLAEARDRAVDGLDLAATAGIVIEEHRGPRVRDLAAERPDVLDRIADIEPHVGRPGDRDGLPGAALGHAPGARIGHDLTDGQPRGAARAREGHVHDQLLPDHAGDVVEQADRKAGRLPDLRGSPQRLGRQSGEGSEPDHLHAVVMRVPRSPHRGPKAADDADGKPVLAKDGSRDLGRAEAVLDRLHDRAGTEQRHAGPRRRRDIEGLRRDDDKVTGPNPICIRFRAGEPDRAVPAGALNPETMSSHRLGVVGPERDGVALVAGVRHERGVDRTHRAAADDRNLCHACLLGPRERWPSAHPGSPALRTGSVPHRTCPAKAALRGPMGWSTGPPSGAEPRTSGPPSSLSRALTFVSAGAMVLSASATSRSESLIAADPQYPAVFPTVLGHGAEPGRAFRERLDWHRWIRDDRF